jgi:serine/threonine protein phosphatase 1
MARLIAIGDIHGCDVALETLLNEIQPAREDVLVTLGDYVDRGMNSARVLELLSELVGSCQFVPLIGNHEIMMFQGLNDPRHFDFWNRHGGEFTLLSYGGDVSMIPQHHITFLSHCLRYHETENHIFVHANYDPYVPMFEQPDQILFWRHILEDVPPPHYSGKTVVVGHTPQWDGTIRNLGHVLMIDTGCYADQWLTAIDLEDDTVWQANNLGQKRKLTLRSAAENEPKN